MSTVRADTVAPAPGRPAWLRDVDELPHAPEPVPLWCENYLTYMWAPDAGVGVWTHMCHRGGPPERWDEKVLITLPGDRVLAAKAIGPGVAAAAATGPQTCALALRCAEPYRRWTMHFDGDARLLGAAELFDAPVADGSHTPVQLRLELAALGPAYDFGEQHLDQSWGHGHYEQHLSFSGSIQVGDAPPVSLAGTGLRDHSWGPRDYAQIGSTAWIHGQFPDSGRTFMAVAVTGKPPRPQFTHAVAGDAAHSAPATVGALPLLVDARDAGAGYELVIDGSVIRAELLDTVRMAFVGPTEIALGRHRGEHVNHDYLIAFTRFEWDGEVGYGVTDRTVELCNP
jgi:hypothetical protein